MNAIDVSVLDNNSAASAADWRLWCRLCAKEDSQNINVFLESAQVAISGSEMHDTVHNVNAARSSRKITKNDSSLMHVIQRHFNIQIKHKEELPQMLCTECFSMVKSLTKFVERVERVQLMYKALQSSTKTTVSSAKSFRLKFGLQAEDHTQIFTQQHLPETHYLATKPKNKNAPEETIIETDVSPASDNPLDIEQPCLAIKFENEYFLENALQIDKNDYDNGISDPFDSDTIETVRESPIDEFNSNSDESDTEDNTNLATLRTNLKTKYKLPHKKQNALGKPQLRERKRKENADIKTSANNIDVQETESSTEDQSNLKTNEFQESFIYNCSECPQQFKRMQNYRNHMKRIHNSAPLVPKIACSQCSEVFNTRAQLKLHSKKHLPLELKQVMPCSYCNKKFTSKSGVDLHIKFAHLDERSFICEECGFAVRTIGTLREHMLVHTDNAPFECEVCHNKFKNRSRLTKHKQIHDEKKHICAVCGLQLNSRTTLNSHMVVHSDKMKHKCDSCGRAFKRAKTLKNHLLIHTGLKPYSCDFCDRTFTVGSSCRQHKKKEHPIELAELEASGERPYTRNIPRIEELKAVTKAAGNLITLVSIQSESTSLGRKPKLLPRDANNLHKMPHTQLGSGSDANAAPQPNAMDVTQADALSDTVKFKQTTTAAISENADASSTNFCNSRHSFISSIDICTRLKKDADSQKQMATRDVNVIVDKHGTNFNAPINQGSMELGLCGNEE